MAIFLVFKISPGCEFHLFVWALLGEVWGKHSGSRGGAFLATCAHTGFFVSFRHLSLSFPGCELRNCFQLGVLNSATSRSSLIQSTHPVLPRNCRKGTLCSNSLFPFGGMKWFFFSPPTNSMYEPQRRFKPPKQVYGNWNRHPNFVKL